MAFFHMDVVEVGILFGLVAGEAGFDNYSFALFLHLLFLIPGNYLYSFKKKM